MEESMSLRHVSIVTRPLLSNFLTKCPKLEYDASGIKRFEDIFRISDELMKHWKEERRDIRRIQLNGVRMRQEQ